MFTLPGLLIHTRLWILRFKSNAVTDGFCKIVELLTTVSCGLTGFCIQPAGNDAKRSQ